MGLLTPPASGRNRPTICRTEVSPSPCNYLYLLFSASLQKMPAVSLFICGRSCAERTVFHLLSPMFFSLRDPFPFPMLYGFPTALVRSPSYPFFFSFWSHISQLFFLCRSKAVPFRGFPDFLWEFSGQTSLGHLVE